MQDVASLRGEASRRRGRTAIQRIATPCMPVRVRLAPPIYPQLINGWQKEEWS